MSPRTFPWAVTKQTEVLPSTETHGKNWCTSPTAAMRAARALSDAFQAHNGFLITACRLKRGPGPAHMARLANHRRQAFLESLGGTVVTITTAPVCGFVCLDWRAVGSEVEAFFFLRLFFSFLQPSVYHFVWTMRWPSFTPDKGTPVEMSLLFCGAITASVPFRFKWLVIFAPPGEMVTSAARAQPHT